MFVVIAVKTQLPVGDYTQNYLELKRLRTTN